MAHKKKKTGHESNRNMFFFFVKSISMEDVISLMEFNYKGDIDHCTDITLGLQNPQAATTSWTNDVWTKGHQVANDGYRLSPCDPCRGLQSTQLAEKKLPRLDVTLWQVVHGSGGHPGPGLMMHLRTSRPHHLELAISQCRLGIPNKMSLNLI